MPLSRCFPKSNSTESSLPAMAGAACNHDAFTPSADDAELGSYAHIIAAGYHRESKPSADEQLVSELNQLSVQERDDLYEEIHGIQGTLTPETPAFLEALYVKLDQSLTLLPNNRRKAYDRALFLKPSLECDRTFHLTFLRSCKYQTARAATRIALYFLHKLKLFGEAKLTKKITLDDLSPDDLDSLRKSRCAFLPRADRSGRTIAFMDLFNEHFKKPENYIRQVWYQIMVASEREDVQMNGVVAVQVALGENRTGWQDLFDVTKLAGSVFDCLPVRTVSVHFCSDDPRAHSVVKAFQMLVGKDYRMRSRAHLGSRIEAQYALMTFGIQIPDSLMNDDNKACSDAIDELLQQQHQKETERTNAAVLPEGICRLAPTPKDVLMGRGRPYHSYMGNLALGETIEKELPRYLSTANRMEKTSINGELVKETKAQGGRFLKRSTLGWEEVDDIAARSKISEMMRQARLKLGKRSGEAMSPALVPLTTPRTSPSPPPLPSTDDIFDITPTELLSSTDALQLMDLDDGYDSRDAKRSRRF